MTVIGMTIYQPTDRYMIDYSTHQPTERYRIQEYNYVHGYRTVRT